MSSDDSSPSSPSSSTTTEETRQSRIWDETTEDQLAVFLNPEHIPEQSETEGEKQPEAPSSAEPEPREPEHPSSPEDIVLRVTAPSTIHEMSATALLTVEVENTQPHSVTLPPITVRTPRHVSAESSPPQRAVLGAHESLTWNIPLTISQAEFTRAVNVLHGGSVSIDALQKHQSYVLTLAARSSTQLQLRAVLDPASPAPGQAAALTVRVGNLSSHTQREKTRTTVRLPNSVRPTALPVGCTARATALVCETKALSGGESREMILPVRVDAAAIPGAQLSPIEVSTASLSDFDLSNNTESVTVTLAHPRTELELRTNTEELVQPGQLLPLDTQIHNNSPNTLIGPATVTLRVDGPVLLRHTEERTPDTAGLPLGCEALTSRSVRCRVTQSLLAADASQVSRRVLAAHARITGGEGEGGGQRRAWNIHTIPVMFEVLPTAKNKAKVVAETVMSYKGKQYNASVDAVVLPPPAPASPEEGQRDNESVPPADELGTRTIAEAEPRHGEVMFTFSTQTRRLYFVGVFSAVAVSVFAMIVLGGMRRRRLVRRSGLWL